MQTRLSHAVLISAAVIIALDVVLAQNEWGTGAVFFVRKVTPNATDNVIRDGDYVNIRGTVGDPWWAISNGAIAGAPPNSAELLVVRKTTPKNPNNPASMDTALHNGDYIQVRGTKGDPWLRISGDRLLADGAPADASTLFISKVTPKRAETPDSMKDTIHDGDYLHIRGTQGDPWLHFSGMRLLVGAPQSHAAGSVSQNSAELGWFNILPCSRWNPLPQFAEQRIHVYADAPQISGIADEVKACAGVALAACVGSSIASYGTACLPAAKTAFVGCLTSKGQQIAQKAAQVQLRFESQCVW